VRLELTRLEYAILERLRQLDPELSALPPQVVEVLSREFTPCGRYVTITGERLKAGGTQLDMVGLANGITAELTVTVPGAGVLELVVNGGESWDGEERAFHFV